MPVMNERRWGLLLQSAEIAAGSFLLCCLIAVFAALGLFLLFPKKKMLRWFFMILAPLPSYIYALTYMNLIRFFGRWIPSLLRVPVAGLLPCILVETMAYLPFAVAIALLSLEQADSREWKAALLMKDADSVYFQIILPRQLPYLMAMGAVIFILSVTDYSIPSLFQVNVYAMEIFSDYSAMGNSAASLWLSLPLIALSVLVILFGVLPLRNVRRPMAAGEEVRPIHSAYVKGLCYLAVAVLVLQILLPVLSLVPFIREMAAEFVPAFEELFHSMVTGILAVILLTPVAAGMALILSEREKTGEKSTSVFLWILTVLPLSIPGVLSGIGVLQFFSDTPLAFLRNDLGMPAIGMAIRYLPFSALIQFGCYMRMDKDKIAAARLLESRRGQAFFRVKLHMMGPGLCISGIVVFLLTLGDVGCALMLMPPGKEPLSVKIYNYLHYGSSETVAGFCLLQVICCILCMSLLYFYAKGHGYAGSKASDKTI